MAAGDDTLNTRLRVAVTGAGGFIGRAIVAARPSNWDVVAVSRQALAHEPGLRNVRVSDPTGVLPGEILRPFDAVIHVAGNADHGLAVREPWSDLMATGVVGAALLSRVPTRRVVLLSSAAVYAGLEGLVDPDRCLEPEMPYGLSKRYLEDLVRALVAAGRIESWLIIRLYNAYGPGERPSRLIPRIAAAIRSRIPFVLTGDPSSLSDPVNVAHVARCLMGAATAGASGIFDLAGGSPTPLSRQVPRIASILGAPDLPIEVRPDADQWPIHFWSDPAPLHRALRLQPGETLEVGVRQYALREGWVSAPSAPT
jgi:nucleoside-diphosphate-sugar epimerase